MWMEKLRRFRRKFWVGRLREKRILRKRDFVM